MKIQGLIEYANLIQQKISLEASLKHEYDLERSIAIAKETIANSEAKISDVYSLILEYNRKYLLLVFLIEYLKEKNIKM